MRFRIALCCLIFWPAMLLAQEMGIAAIVNDEVISTYDLEQRIDLALGTSGQPNLPQLRAQARAALLDGLVEEKLRLQEAERYTIDVSDKEIDTAIAAIERQQDKPPGSLSAMIQANNLPYNSFRQQIKSQVAWQKLLARQVRRNVSVSEEEIRRAEERLSQGRSIAQVQLASIILPIQPYYGDAQLLGIARDIRSQLLSGVDPAKLLAAYEKRVKLEFAPVTWIARDQLDTAIRDILASMKVGDIAEPVRTPSGYQIIRLIDTRSISTQPVQNAEIAVKQIVLKLNDNSSDTEIDSKMSIARAIAQYPGSCTESGIAGLRQFDGLNIEVNYLRTMLSNMSPEIRSLLEPLPVTGITQPFASEDGIHLLMLCERISVPVPKPDTQQIKNALMEQKLQLEAEKYLRQLRREAFIDKRI